MAIGGFAHSGLGYAASRSLRARKYAFTPYNPTVPAGSYDPGLDAALSAAQRGLQDTTADTETGQQRALADYGLSRDQVLQQQARGVADLGTSRANEEQDFARNVQLLTRQYGQLGDRQRQQAVTQGVSHGGALLQAAAKRTANQGIEQQGLDTARQRFLDANTLAGSRLGEDVTSRLGELGLGYQRGSTDLGTGLLRAQREAGQFGVDTQAQKLFQASQAGYVAPTRPKNEFVSAGGTSYRVLKTKAGPVYVDQYGRRLRGRLA